MKKHLFQYEHDLQIEVLYLGEVKKELRNLIDRFNKESAKMLAPEFDSLTNKLRVKGDEVKDCEARIKALEKRIFSLRNFGQ